MKKLYTLLLLSFAFILNAQTTITGWDFNGSTTTSTTGTGTIALLGGVTEGYALGNDVTAGSTDKGLNITAFPVDGTGSGTAGISANVSTANYTGISVSYDRKGSNTGSRWEQFEYTVNGTTWIVLNNNGGTTTNVGTGTLWPTTTYTLPTTANNNPNFAVRMTSIFAPATSAYQAIGATSNYASGGTWRFDNLKIQGTTLSVKQNDIAGLSLYPNPVTNGTLNINSDANAERTITIFDILGKQVIKTTTSNTSINVSALNAGIYMVKIIEEGKTATRKLVVR